MPRLAFSGYEVTSIALDGKVSTATLTAGSTYGHVVKTSQYFQLRPIDIRIDSTLIDTKQLEFDNTGSVWHLPLHLDAFTDEREEVRPLRCRFPKTRIVDTITINVTGDDQGQLGLVLDIVDIV
jgi:hypothetical protein